MKTRRLLTICLSGALLGPAAYAGGPAPSNAIQVVTAPVAAAMPTTVAVAAPAVVTAVVAPQPPVDEPIEIGYIEADIQNVLRTLAAKAGRQFDSRRRSDWQGHGQFEGDLVRAGNAVDRRIQGLRVRERQ